MSADEHPSISRFCALCGHAMTLERCGSAAVSGGDGMLPLCHTDDHDCYRAWTVYGIRPDRLPLVERYVD
jgi:hypothetical protein